MDTALGGVIKLEDTLSSNDCLSFYTPDLNDLKLETQHNLKRQQEKFNILKEVLSSEKKYLSDLREIVEGYYDEIYKVTNEDDEFVYQIFSNIKEIYDFTKSFYKLLEESSNDEVGIANCFIKKHKTFQRLYCVYCQNYKTAYDFTDKLEADGTICKIIQKVKLKYGHCLKLATYLQLPVLRITKYHLLLQRYLKLLEKDSFAYAQVMEALELMKQVNNQINKNMPDEMGDGSSSTSSGDSNSVMSTLNIQNLINSYGTILKQGNIMLTQTKKVHYVIVFQSMLVVRKSGSPTQIMHSISNECLAFLPKTSLTKNKYFTIIDYSQAKDDEMWQFTFKAKTIEDKKDWQSSIITCILNGYGKRLPEHIKSKVMDMKQQQQESNNQENHHQQHHFLLNTNGANALATMRRSSNYMLLKNKMPNFKKLTEFRHSLKNEYKSCDKINSMDTTDQQQNAKIMLITAPIVSLSPREEKKELNRRMSSPVQSSKFVKLLDKTIHFNNTLSHSTSNTPQMAHKTTTHNKDELIDKIFSKFRKDKQSSVAKSALNLSTTNNTQAESSEYKNKPIEHIRKDINAIFDQLNMSLEEISGNLAAKNDHDVVKTESFLHYEKLFKPEEKKKRPKKDEHSKDLAEILNKIDDFCGNRSSKSSINSEEGYYSNHDSSISTQNEVANNNLLLLPQSVMALPPPPAQFQSPVKSEDVHRTFSTPELFKELNLSLEKSAARKEPLYHKRNSLNASNKSSILSKISSSIGNKKSSSNMHLNTVEIDTTTSNNNNVLSTPKNAIYSQFSPRQLLKNNTSLSKIKTKFVHDNFNSYSLNLSFNKMNESNTNTTNISTPQPLLSKSLHSNKLEFMTMSLVDPSESTCTSSSSDDSSFFNAFTLGGSKESNENDNSFDTNFNDPDDNLNINVKDLITKFENRKMIFNKHRPI